MRGQKQVSRKDGKGEEERRGLYREDERGEKMKRRGQRRGGSWRYRFWKFRL